MKVTNSIAIMQPYIFPYIGYFSLIQATELFVFYDDVNYINKGWINRNRILLNGKDHMITIPCKDASQNKLIMDIDQGLDEKSRKKLMSTIQAAYSKAPFYNEVKGLVEDVLYSDTKTISDLAIYSIERVCDYMGVDANFKRSSAAYDNRELKKGDRLIDISLAEGKKNYINPEGGKEIYTKEYFVDKGVNLMFIKSQRYEYKQFTGDFVPWLSVIDVLMFNEPDKIKTSILPAYNLE